MHTCHPKEHLCSAAHILCAMLLFVYLFSVPFCLPASAEHPAAPETYQVGTAYLSCLDTGNVLFEKNADSVIYPASTAKIMSGLLLCRALYTRLDDTVTLTDAMLSGVSGRSLHLAVGEVLTVRDLLYAALCGSYNDALNALAVYAAGSVAEFVSVMNQEAARLGASHTHYTNPLGLHDDAMYTTARDVAVIAREAYGNELYMTVTSETLHTIPATHVSDARNITNRNALLSDTSQNYRNGWCRGMSAGMTDEGGWCVVTVCERDGVSLLCIVMQGADVPNGSVIPAYTYANSLLAWARSNFGIREILAPGSVYVKLPVAMTGLSSSKTGLVVPEGLSAYLPYDADTENDLTFLYALTDGELVAPLSAGQVVGQVSVMYNGEVVGTAHLVVTEDFARNGFLDGMQSFRAYLGSRAFISAVIIFLILLLLYLRLVTGPGKRFGTRLNRRRRTKRYFRR